MLPKISFSVFLCLLFAQTSFGATAYQTKNKGLSDATHLSLYRGDCVALSKVYFDNAHTCYSLTSDNTDTFYAHVDNVLLTNNTGELGYWLIFLMNGKSGEWEHSLLTGSSVKRKPIEIRSATQEELKQIAEAIALKQASFGREKSDKEIIMLWATRELRSKAAERGSSIQSKL